MEIIKSTTTLKLQGFVSKLRAVAIHGYSPQRASGGCKTKGNADN